jgi:hypothetical protein
MSATKVATSSRPSALCDERTRHTCMMQGGLDVLALAFRIDQNIINPLGALQPLPRFKTFEFPLGTHTGYQVCPRYRICCQTLCIIPHQWQVDQRRRHPVQNSNRIVPACADVDLQRMNLCTVRNSSDARLLLCRTSPASGMLSSSQRAC